MEPCARSSTDSCALELVRVCLEANEFREALQRLDALPIQQQLAFDAHELRAEVLWRSGDLSNLACHIHAGRHRLKSRKAQLLRVLFESRILLEQGAHETLVTHASRLGSSENGGRECVGGGAPEDPCETDNPGDPATILLQGRIQLLRGSGLYGLNDIEKARVTFERQLGSFERIGERSMVANCLVSLGTCEWSAWRWTKAVGYYRRAIQIFRELGDPNRLRVALMNLGVLRLYRGHFESARVELDRALALSYELDESESIATALASLALLHIRTEQIEEARRYLAEAWRVSRLHPDKRILAVMHGIGGELALEQGRYDLARRWLDRTVRLAKQGRFPDVENDAQCRLAEIELGEGRTEAALKRVTYTADVFRDAEDRYKLAVAQRVHGQCLLAVRRVDEARAMLEDARAFLDDIGERFERQRIDRLLQLARTGRYLLDIRNGDARSGFLPSPGASHQPKSRSRTRKPDLLPHHPDFPEMIGRSPRFLDVLEKAKRYAADSRPVLIHGATGTGKEVLARILHRSSSRNRHAFVPFNCGTSTPEMFDAELFGHLKGAFTGATDSRRGLVREAEGGTLFLDEIGELSAQSQPRLLRFLDSGELRPVGSDQLEAVSVRVVAATHQDLESQIRTRKFRPDLFYRLSTFRLELPSLKDRMEDLELLVGHFAEELRRDGYTEFKGVSDQALGLMAGYNWPGNVRELRSEVTRLANLARSGVSSSLWTPEGMRSGWTEGEPVSQRLEDRSVASTAGGDGAEPTSAHRRRIEQVLVATHGNITVAAKRLGFSRAKLYRLLETWELRPEDFRME